MQLDEFFDYKNKLMKDLCNSEEIVKLLTRKTDVTVPDTSLIYKQIFPYEFIPDTVDKAKTYICFDVDIISVPNQTYYYPALYIWVFTHKSNMRTDGGGIMTDKVCVEINNILNGNRTYGLGKLDLYSVDRFSPADDYLGRVLSYSAIDFNRDSRYKHPLPANRKKGL